MSKKNSKADQPSANESKTKESFRFVYSLAENIGLERAVTAINEGFEELEIDRNLIASYLFVNAQRLLSEADFQEIRARSFDAKASLLNLAKKAETGEDLPLDIQKALRAYYGIGDTTKRKKSKDEESTKKNVNPAALAAGAAEA